MLRPGNAGANTAADHLDVLESALAQRPDLPQASRVLVRADSGGSAQDLPRLPARRQGGLFSVSLHLSEPIRAAICRLQAHRSVWQPALTQDGQVRDGAHVAEATGLVDVSDTRRVPGWSTSGTAPTPAWSSASATARTPAWPTCARRRSTSTRSGCSLVLAAQDLLAFFAVLAVDGDLTKAEPKPSATRTLAAGDVGELASSAWVATRGFAVVVRETDGSWGALTLVLRPDRAGAWRIIEVTRPPLASHALASTGRRAPDGVAYAGQ